MALLSLILVLLPFHALLTVGYAALIGHFDLLRLWKEILLLLLVPVAVWLVAKSPDIRRQLTGGWLFWAIAAYALLTLLLGAVALVKGQVNSYALVYAWVVNLRFLLMFVVAFVLAARSDWLRRSWRRWLVWPAAAAIGFGLLQIFVLPPDWLQHLGYGPATIPAYETVDQKPDYVRIQSTLRGANPLGAYLVVALTAVIVLLMQPLAQSSGKSKAGKRWQNRYDRRQIAGVVLLSAGLLVLVNTYSRSAYAGMAVAALSAVVLAVHGRRAKQRLALAVVGLALVATVGLLTLRDNSRFENTFFHTDSSSRSAVSSNAQRAAYAESALHDVLHEPFGRGPGTAGPASVHNRQPARIAENYYLQIAQETGWLGLGLFLAIIVGVAHRLYAQRNDPLGRTLLASLIGISLVNMVLHAWTDDTLSLLWWGLAGIALALPVANNKTKRKEPHHV